MTHFSQETRRETRLRVVYIAARETWVNLHPLVCYDFKTRLPCAQKFVMGFHDVVKWNWSTPHNH